MLKYGIKIDEHSFDENKRGRKPNPYTVISEDALVSLERDLEDVPGKCGLQYASWTGEAVQDYLKSFFNIEVSMNYLYKFLENHNIISKAASRKNPHSNPYEVKKIKDEIYYKFKDAIKNNETVVFLDVTHVQQGSRTYGFAKKGKEAVYSYTTENIHCEYSLLTIIGFDFVMVFKHKGSMKAENYCEYLNKLHEKYPDKKFRIFRDNARIHQAGEILEKFVELELNKYLKFESIPPYSPELNPVELMNNEFKNTLKKFECLDKKDVSRHTDNFISMFQDNENTSKIEGRRKVKQYTKGKECSFIYENYLRAMRDIRKEKLKNRKMSLEQKDHTRESA